MNILTLLFLPLVAQGHAQCPPHVMNTVEIQMVAANRHGVSGQGLVETGIFDTDIVEQGALGEANTQSDLDDLLFYFSSHAQAVGDSTGPTMTPWLELRPIGYVEQGVLGRTSDPAPVANKSTASQSTTK